MYNTSQNYKNYIKEPSRMFESKIILGSRTLNNDDVIQLKTELQQPSNGFTLGSCISKSLELTLNNDGGAYASVGIVNVSLGLKMGELIEYIPQGIFNIDKVEKTDYTVKVTAYDNMIKFETAYSEKYDNPTLKQVIQQLQDITGVEFDSSVTIPSYTLNKLSGYTCREILGYVASLMGGNAYITREGKLTIVTPVEVDYTVTSNNYWDYDLEDNTYKIGMITCQNKLKNDAVDESDDYEAIEEKNTISAGSLGTDNMELTFVNPWMTETILNTVYNKLKSFSFLGYSMKWQGDLSIDVGNIINVTDRHGVTRKALVFSDKINYNGGLTQETGAKGQTKSSNEFSTVDAPTELDRISVKLLLAEKAIIQKANINDLTAVSAKVGTLDASIANINTALINYAKVDDLNATNANISNLNAQYANLSSSIINKADIAELNATNANISNLKATVADISTLVSGNLTSANIQSLVLTSSKVTVDNGFIKNAMIESLDATKINTGILNTSKISVTSSDGSLLIAGATQQFKDKNGKVRIQMGQDAQGNFNFILVASDGTTTLIDGTGVKANAIADKLIKTNMVADSAIGEQQINYSSFVTGFNKSTNTSYINASKVSIDLTGQTLDIAFNNINTTVSTVQTTANTAKSTANTANTNASTAVNTANTALSTANNIQVGGRNLYKGTKDFNSSYWSVQGSSQILICDYDSNYKMATICGTYDSGGIIGSLTSTQGFDFSDLTKTWTISAMFKGTLDNQIIGITVSSGRISWKAQSVSNGTWKKLSWTFTGDGNSLFNFRFEHSSATVTSPIYVAQIKVEEGNKVTTWSPAPEDVDQAIASVKTITETNTTSISAIQGQISTLISNTTITNTDGTTTQLKDAYNGTVNTINSMKTSIGELITDSDANTKNITSVTSRTSTLETNLSSISATLSSTKSTVDAHTTQISTANTNITTALNNASNAVSTANTANTTANTAKTTATTASTNASNAVTTANSASSNASTALTNSNTAISTANTASTNASGAVSTANKASTDVATLTTTVTNTVSRVSSLELTANSLTTRVGNTETAISSLQIGGRNLILNSDFTKGSNIFFAISTNGVTISVVADPTYTNCLKVIPLSSGSGYYGINTEGKLTNVLQTGSHYSYSFYLKADAAMTVYVGYQGSSISNSTAFNVTTSWQRFKIENELDSNNNRSLRFYTASGTSAFYVTRIKFEQGTKCTDWMPAPEDIDSSIASVKDYATTTINSNVSTINQTTTSIQAQVTSLQSSVSTINTTLGNKAEKSTVESISNSVTSLNTTLNGITGRVSSLETNTTTLTTKLNDLNVGGRNLLITSNAYKGYWLDINGELQTNSTTDVMRDYISVIPGEVLIFQKENSEEYFRYNWYDVNKNYISREPNRNNLFKLTVPQNAYYLWISYPNTGRLKIEKGNIPTDWTPAPEDVENEITTVQETVTSNTTEISALKNSISLKVDSTTLNSYKDTVNGQINTINSSISSMQSSIDLQLDSIKSSVSKTVSTKNLINNSAFNKELGFINKTGTNYACRISKKSEYTGWGYVNAPVADDNVLYIRYDKGGDNYCEFRDLYAMVKPNTKYTFSYYYTLNGPYTAPSSFLYERNASGFGKIIYTNPIIIGPDKACSRDTWIRYSRTLTTGSDTDSIMVRFGFHSNDGSCEMLIAGLQLEESSSVTDWVEGNVSNIGTVITQSPTEVMTAFNGISKYFEVSSGGAKFGNIATGDYTSMNDKGLIHHVGGSEYEYVYLTYTQPITAVLVNSSDWQYFTIEYQDTLKTLLNGRIPKQIIFSGADTSPDDTSSYFEVYCKTYVIVTEITANNFTVKIKGRSRLVAPSYTVSNNQIFLKFKTYYGGLFSADAIIIA